MVGVALGIIASVFTARAGFAEITALIIVVAWLFMAITVGAWAVNVIDISPNQASTGIIYRFYNGILNVMGALNSLILTWIAGNIGFSLASGAPSFSYWYSWLRFFLSSTGAATRGSLMQRL
jgi:ACS family D-galactonate transporter-like MFS transporter